jgi:hypothetical protein
LEPCSSSFLCRFSLSITATVGPDFSRDVMRPYANQVLLLLLNRLQTKPSASFTQAFVYFVSLLSAVESVGPDFVIQSLDAIQAG